MKLLWDELMYLNSDLITDNEDFMSSKLDTDLELFMNKGVSARVLYNSGVAKDYVLGPSTPLL